MTMLIIEDAICNIQRKRKNFLCNCNIGNGIKAVEPVDERNHYENLLRKRSKILMLRKGLVNCLA